jgi:hypothetical protein
MEEFRFHLTLTGRLEAVERARVAAILEPLVAPVCTRPTPVDSLAIFTQQNRDAPFLLTRRFPFAGL